jgi:MinD superfamily P-loop ATPase
LRCRQTAIGSLFHVERAAEHDSCERIVDLLKTTGRKSALSAPNSTTLVNAPPGFGCTVFTALAGANAVLIVTEPSPSMVHDVRRLLLLVNALCLKAGIVINKCDLWPDAALEIGVAAEAFGAEVVATLPFDEGIPALLAQSRLPVELSGEFLRKLESIAAWVGRQNVAD